MRSGPGVSITVVLADCAGMTKQAMSELVADLERLGYLARRPDRTDGRAKLIGFTERGRQAVDAAMRAFSEIEAALETRLGPKAVRTLRRGLLEMASAPLERLATGENP